MDKITISKNGSFVEMPPTGDISVGGTELAIESTMASGKLVKDIVGHRVVVTAAWELIPAECMSSLLLLLRQGGYFDVEYPDPVLGMHTRAFSIKYPTPKIFKFIDGHPFWYGISLEMTAQEV